jgi:hypothetical protein
VNFSGRNLLCEVLASYVATNAPVRGHLFESGYSSSDNSLIQSVYLYEWSVCC